MSLRGGVGLAHISPTLRFNQRSNLSGKERMNLARTMPAAVARTTTSGPTMFAPRGVWLHARKPLIKEERSINRTLAPPADAYLGNMNSQYALAVTALPNTGIVGQILRMF